MNAVRLLEVSLSAAVVILATAVLRLIFRKLRVSKRAILLLWIVVAVRLMIPIPLYSPFGIIPAFSANNRSTETKWNSSEPFFNGEALPGTASDSIQRETEVKPISSDAVTVSSRQEKSTPAISLDQLLLVVYLTGLAGMAAYFIISYWILVRKTKKSVHIEKNLYAADWIGTAFVLGFVRPKVFVPAAMGKEFRGMVLKHEYAHIAHGDQWYKAFAFLLLAVHWFNPMVWLAYHLFNEDLEYACDERVIKGMSEAERRDYSEALLSVSGGSRLSVSVPVAFSKKSVIGRIKAICGRQKHAAFLSVLAVLISFALGACLIPNNSVPESDVRESHNDSVDPVLQQALDEIGTAGNSVLNYSIINKAQTVAYNAPLFFLNEGDSDLFRSLIGQIRGTETRDTDAAAYKYEDSITMRDKSGDPELTLYRPGAAVLKTKAGEHVYKLVTEKAWGTTYEKLYGFLTSVTFDFEKKEFGGVYPFSEDQRAMALVSDAEGMDEVMDFVLGYFDAWNHGAKIPATESVIQKWTPVYEKGIDWTKEQSFIAEDWTDGYMRYYYFTRLDNLLWLTQESAAMIVTANGYRHLIETERSGNSWIVTADLMAVNADGFAEEDRGAAEAAIRKAAETSVAALTETDVEEATEAVKEAFLRQQAFFGGIATEEEIESQRSRIITEAYDRETNVENVCKYISQGHPFDPRVPMVILKATADGTITVAGKEVRFNGFELPPMVVGKTADGWVGKGAMTEY